MEGAMSGAWSIPIGLEVFGADGKKVGTVRGAEGNDLVIEKGLLFSTDYFIPMSVVASFDGERLILKVTAEEALSRDWGREPDPDVSPWAEAAEATTDLAATTGAGAYNDDTANFGPDDEGEAESDSR